MATITIRVPDATHAKLQRLATEEGRSIGQVIDELLTRYERDRFFEELGEDFRRLRADPTASAEYDAEVAAWDSTLLDGLDGLSYEETSAEGPTDEGFRLPRPRFRASRGSSRAKDGEMTGFQFLIES